MKSLIIIALIILITYSCSTPEESVNNSGNSNNITKTQKNTVIEKSESSQNSLQENANSFSEQIFLSAGNLENALSNNSNVDFNEQTMQMLNLAETENDLKEVFEIAGISNSQEVINILKTNIAIQQSFIEQNPSFYSLTSEKQVELLNNSIELTKNSYVTQMHIPDYALLTTPRCGRIFNANVDQCAEDFAFCAVFAVAGAYAGLVPGLLAAGYCMATKLICDKRAKKNYQECALDKNLAPLTGILTTHCDKYGDFCWQTDSNGKYVGTL